MMPTAQCSLVALAVVLITASLDGLAHPLDNSDGSRTTLLLGEDMVIAPGTDPEAPCESGPLGMESGAIPDSSLTASSTYGSSYLTPKARLNIGVEGWIPRPPQDQWFQVNLGDYTAVTGIIIQGHSGGGNYIRTFSIQYSNTGESDDWLDMTNIDGDPIQLNGNTGNGQQVTVVFPVVLMARFIRILPTAWNVVTYRLKFELLGCRDGVVRLVNGDRALSGRVEIYHQDEWGVVCDIDWDFKDATIVCHELGYLEAVEAKTGSVYGESDLPIVMNRVSCKGTEARLKDCPFLCTIPAQCNNTSQAGVVCKENSIRLVGGSNRTSGRVEINRDGNWGTVCDNDWDISDAAVACRQLGFSDAVEAVEGGRFGQGQGPVLMDGLACHGSEKEITDCPSLCWENTSCNHTQDAGVICHDGKLSPPIEQDTFDLQ